MRSSVIIWAWRRFLHDGDRTPIQPAHIVVKRERSKPGRPFSFHRNQWRGLGILWRSSQWTRSQELEETRWRNRKLASSNKTNWKNHQGYFMGRLWDSAERISARWNYDHRFLFCINVRTVALCHCGERWWLTSAILFRLLFERETSSN